MENEVSKRFIESECISKLKHYLPNQAPLKDFIHHNTLHSFQHLEFHSGIQKASKLFGYKTYLGIEEYRNLYKEGVIQDHILDSIIAKNQFRSNITSLTKEDLLHKNYKEYYSQRIGKYRKNWERKYGLTLEKFIHPILFRLVGGYLDQGISETFFPFTEKSFYSSVLALEENSFFKIVKSDIAKSFLFKKERSISELLDILVGDTRTYERYLFDQQFEHPGWSGMIQNLESNPGSLLDKRSISLYDFIYLELVLELDLIERRLGNHWKPMKNWVEIEDYDLFSPFETEELDDVYRIWQEAYEWTVYDPLLYGMQHPTRIDEESLDQFQAVFCIDDRECSSRRHLEQINPRIRTFGTAGFFNLDIYFKPEHGKFLSKTCPAPMTPSTVIAEYERKKFIRSSSLKGYIQKLNHKFFGSLQVSPFQYMDRNSRLNIEKQKFNSANSEHSQSHPGVRTGYTVDEMASRFEGLLRSIGLEEDFARIVYIIGHGASSKNNTYYAGYDCGACSGRPGSVNARVAASIGNRSDVRSILDSRGIKIPKDTVFIGAIRDSTADRIEYFLDTKLKPEQAISHKEFQDLFARSSVWNAKERSRRFPSFNTNLPIEVIHKDIIKRSQSLMQPRPEWNHANNAFCIVGRREMNKHLFFDRRAFLNSYDYSRDSDGDELFKILQAAVPVCGGINLEYYFSRVDNSRLGSGTKLSHNVIGLIGVANGIDGDLRTGLPAQMIHIHDPIRLLMIVENTPDRILTVIRRNKNILEWFDNKWIHLVSIDPDTKKLYIYENTSFIEYNTFTKTLPHVLDLDLLWESSSSSLPIYTIGAK